MQPMESQGILSCTFASAVPTIWACMRQARQMTIQGLDTNSGVAFSKGFARTSWNGTRATAHPHGARWLHASRLAGGSVHASQKTRRYWAQRSQASAESAAKA